MAADARWAAEGVEAAQYEGENVSRMSRLLGARRIVLYDSVGSTMDAAHALAESGAPAGTVVLADEQTTGRGRQGSVWLSARGQGVWLTLLERPDDGRALEVLSLRVGLAASQALDQFAPEPVRLKWPNDLFLGHGKVAGVLVEARWRLGRPDWVAIGLGVNVRAPANLPRAQALREGTSRLEVLRSLVPILRAAAARTGHLDERELREYAARDYARGRPCVRPAPGVVDGVSPDGALVVRTANAVREYRSGSLVLEEEQ